MDGIGLIYSDKHLVIVNKPADLLSVPGRGEDKQDCLVKRVQRQFPTARIVHRLDCATSGLMVLALDADAHRELSRQFHDREVEKEYVALVYGRPALEKGEVAEPLMTDWPNRPRQIVDPSGKAALTLFECIEYHDRFTRVRLQPVTGRSHQLRVHMQYLGHPILGDRLYAEDAALGLAKRLCLHARRLSIRQPNTKERLDFTHEADF